MADEQSEYTWRGAQASHTCAYLYPHLVRWLDAIPASGRILDAGCGNGAVLGELGKTNSWHLHGLEVSVSGVEQARRAHPEITFEQADLTADLSGHHFWGTCDAVVSLEVVEHVFLPRSFARNCSGFLRPGGRLIVSTPYHGYLKNLALAATGAMDKHFTALWDYGHIKFWSRKTLQSLLEEAGLKVIAFEGAGRVPFLWKSMVMVAEKPK